MAGAEAVRKQIASAFLGVHGDHRTKEERQADEEMRAAIQEDAAIQGEADDVSEFIDWIEETDDVDVEVMNEVTDDVSDVLADCVLTLEQTLPQVRRMDAHHAWEISVPLEDADTLIQQALLAQMD